MMWCRVGAALLTFLLAAFVVSTAALVALDSLRETQVSTPTIVRTDYDMPEAAWLVPVLVVSGTESAAAGGETEIVEAAASDIDAPPVWRTVRATTGELLFPARATAWSRRLRGVGTGGLREG